MNFKDESASINETIAKLLGLSDGDIQVDLSDNPTTKNGESPSRKMRKSKTFNFKDLIKQIENDKLLQDQLAEEEYARKRRESLLKRSQNNTTIKPAAIDHIPPPPDEKANVIEKMNKPKISFSEEVKVHIVEKEDVKPFSQVEEEKKEESKNDNVDIQNIKEIEIKNKENIGEIQKIEKEGNKINETMNIEETKRIEEDNVKEDNNLNKPEIKLETIEHNKTDTESKPKDLKKEEITKEPHVKKLSIIKAKEKKVKLNTSSIQPSIRNSTRTSINSCRTQTTKTPPKSSSLKKSENTTESNAQRSSLKKKQMKIVIPPLKLKVHQKTEINTEQKPKVTKQKYDPYKTEIISPRKFHRGSYTSRPKTKSHTKQNSLSDEKPMVTEGSKTKRGSNPKNFDEAYSRFKINRKELDEKIESMRKKKEILETKEVTGKPKININSKMILSKITKDFYERQLSYEKKRKAKQERLAQELKRKKEEEIKKNIKPIPKITKEDIASKLSEFKEWEKRKKEKIERLKKNQEAKENEEFNKKNKKTPNHYTKKEIEEACNRLYKDDVKKRYINKTILHHVYKPSFSPSINHDRNKKIKNTVLKGRFADTSFDINEKTEIRSSWKKKNEPLLELNETKEDKKFQNILRKKIFNKTPNKKRSNENITIEKNNTINITNEKEKNQSLEINDTNNEQMLKEEKKIEIIQNIKNIVISNENKDIQEKNLPILKEVITEDK